MALPVMEYVRALAEGIGPRPLGSRANLQAADYIRSRFEAFGLQVEKQEFDCPVWEHKATRLTRVGDVFPAAANHFSPPIDITAPILPVGTLRELETAHLSGRIGILYGELMPGMGLGCRKAFYYPESDQRTVALVEEKRPAALITVHPRANARVRMIHDWEFRIPSATVNAQVGAQFVHDGRPLHLKIDSTATPGRFANIIGRTTKETKRVILCAHFDTVLDTPGAVDNASGIGTLLAAAEMIAKTPLSSSVEFLALNGEENGGAGVAEYLRQCEPTLGDIVAVVNVDGVGQVAGVNSVTLIDGTLQVRQAVDSVYARFPGIAWVGPWYESDHTAFVSRGLPSIALSSVGVTDINHTPNDSFEWLSADRMGEALRFVTEILVQLTGM